jgi:hypothetical protein
MWNISVPATPVASQADSVEDAEPVSKHGFRAQNSWAVPTWLKPAKGRTRRWRLVALR